MKTIRFENSSKVAHVDDRWYDVFKDDEWHEQRSAKTSYAYRKVDKPDGTPSIEFMHRLIMGLDEFDERVVDHINRNGLWNLESNLRIATKSQNQANRGLNNNSKTGYKGVTKHRASGKLQAHASRDRLLIYLGLFTSEIEAAVAYNFAAEALHGAFALLNVIPPELQPDPQRAEKIRSRVIVILRKKKLLAP